MEYQEMVYMMIAGIIMGILAVIVSTDLINPLLSSPVLTEKAANRIALAVDTLAGIDDGEIKIPVEMRDEYYVRVSYEQKGKKDGYAIDETGWYVIATAKDGERESFGVSRIHAYPSRGASDLANDIPRPSVVCVTKKDGDYPRVNDCWR